MRDCEKWAELFETLKPYETVCNIAGSPRFRVYETDFGLGEPDRVELVSMNRDGEVVLVRGKQEETVQISVSLGSNQMDTFAESFLAGSNN